MKRPVKVVPAFSSSDGTVELGEPRLMRVAPSSYPQLFGYKEDKNILGYKSYVPAGFKPSICGILRFSMFFQSIRSMRTSGSYECECSIWIEDEDGDEIFRLFFESHGPVEPLYYGHWEDPTVPETFMGSPTGSALKGFWVEDGDHELVIPQQVDPVGGTMEQGQTSAGILFRRAGGEGVDIRARSDLYKVDIPYGSKVFFDGYMKVHNPDIPDDEITKPNILCYQDAGQMIEKININDFDRNFRTLSRQVSARAMILYHAASSSQGLGSVYCTQEMYVMDGGWWFKYLDDHYDPGIPGYYEAGLTKKDLYHRATSAREMKFFIMWRSLDGACTVCFGDYTLDLSRGFATEAILKNRTALMEYTKHHPAYGFIPTSNVYVQETTKLFPALASRDQVKFGGVLKSLDGRIIWAERTTVKDPWMLYSRVPGYYGGSDVTELGKLWDADENMVYCQIIDVPGNGAAVFAIFEQIKEYREDGTLIEPAPPVSVDPPLEEGEELPEPEETDSEPNYGPDRYITYRRECKWVFKFSPDATQWPDDIEEVVIKDFGQSTRGASLPANIYWKDGVYTVTNHSTLTFISRKGGVKDSWKKFPEEI
jgi:hypothetical protein